MKKAFSVFMMCVLLLETFTYSQDSIRSNNVSPVAMNIEEESTSSYFNLPTVVMPSPNAASLGVYGKIPTGLYTGIPNISVPLYEINLDGKTFPIALSYNASGVKLSQEASWVGLGWNLQAGGCIVDEIRGFNDFWAYDTSGPLGHYYESSWPYFIDSISNTVYENALMYAYNNNMQAFRHDLSIYDQCYNNTMDLEPDLFHFNFGQYTGTMCFRNAGNNNGTWQKPEAFILNNQQYLCATYDTDKRNWHIQDGDGYSYYFATYEITESRTHIATEYNPPINKDYIYPNPDHPRDITSWYLDSIVSPKGHCIKFEYKKEEIYTGLSIGEDVSYITDIAGKANSGSYVSPNLYGTYKKYNLSYSKITQALLTKIIFPEGEILFLTSERKDIEAVNSAKKAEKLDNIVVKNYLGKIVKKYDFSYSYNGYTGNYNTCRLMLDCLKEPLNDSKEYSFTYDSGSLPAKDSYAVDFWGYFNGHYPQRSIDRYFLLSPPKYAPFGLFDWAYFKGKEMRSDSIYMQYGMLKEITYPTGGKSKFVYEPHQFANQFYCGDFRMETERFGYTVYNVDYNHIVGPSFQISDIIHPYSIDWAYSWPAIVAPMEMDISVVLEKFNSDTGKFTPYKTFNFITPFDNSGDHLNSPLFMIQERGTYRFSLYKSAYSECYLYATLIAYQYQYCNTGGGLRIKEIINQDKDNTVTLHKKYNYNCDGKSSGLLMVEPQPFCYFRLTTNWQWVFIGEYLNAYFNYNPIGDCGSGGPVGYSCVEEIMENEDKYGKLVNFYSNRQNIAELSNEQFIPNFPINPDPNNGQLMSSISYDKDGNIVKIRDFFYTTDKLLQQKGLKLYKPVITGTIVDMPERNMCKLYDMNIVTTSLDKIIEFSRLGNNLADTVVTEYSYQYNPVNRLKSKESSYEKGTQKTTSVDIKYPSDYNIEPYSTMLNQHFANYPIEVSEKVNELVKSASKQYYKDTLDMWLPVQVAKLNLDKLTNSIGEQDYKMEYQCRYNKQGNIAEIILKDGTHIVYLWGYRGLYPIAEIKNATYQSVQQILGTSVIESLSKANQPGSGMRLVENLRGTLPDAQITTYTYQPLIGVTSIKTPNEVTMYYTYNDAGQLVEQYRYKDGVKRVIQQYDYNYQE